MYFKKYVVVKDPMEVQRSRISHLPFWDGGGRDGGDEMHETTFQNHFRILDPVVPDRATAPPVSPNFEHRDLKHIRERRTETTVSFPSHQPIPVIQPRQTHFTMHRTNFKMHFDSKSGTFCTTNSEAFQRLPTSVTRPFLPITSFMTNLPKGKYPEPTYRSSYTKHEVSPILRAKPMRKTGVESTLTENIRSRFCSSSYKEQFQNRWCPPLPPLQSAEQQRVQHSSVVMGDQDKILEKQTTYSNSFRQSGAHRYVFFYCQVAPRQIIQKPKRSSIDYILCYLLPKFLMIKLDYIYVSSVQKTWSVYFNSPAILKELLPKLKKHQPINLRELADDKWNTTTSEEFPALKCDPVHLVRKNKNVSSVFKGETLMCNRDRMTTTNQSFFPETNHMQFPAHVDGASIRTMSSIEFGRPNLAGTFYSTTSQEQFPSKEVDRPRPEIYPPSHLLVEQEPDLMLTTVQRDFVPLNCRRQELSSFQLQQVKGSHIRPQLSTHDFRTTHNEAFVPKPYSKASLDNPPFQHISHMCF